MNRKIRRSHILIGLTGNIATGKSEVARLLARLGARVIDADQIAHEVMHPGGPAYDQVVEAFGPGVLAVDGAIDRARLGAIVFRDPSALRRLEAAVHPATIAEVGRRIAQATEPVVVVEAIKLIEAGMHRHYDALWVVTAPRRLQIARLMATRGLSEEEAVLRVDAQPPQEEKAALADTVIVNDGDLERLRQKVEAAWAQIHAKGTIRPVQQDSIEATAGMAHGDRFMSEQSQVRRLIDRLEETEPENPHPGSAAVEVRRARRDEIPAIAALVRKAARSNVQVDEAEVTDWLFGKGLLVAMHGNTLVGVAAWQAENLLSVTDLFHVSPARLREEAGGGLLHAIEAEANVLMCEANVILLPARTSKAVRTFLQGQGYEPKDLKALHRIWREVLKDFVSGEPDLMVKRLREQMVMVPV